MKKFTLKNAIQLYNVHQKILDQNIGSAKFKIRLSINSRKLNEVIQPIRSLQNSSEYKKYLFQMQQKRIQLCQMFADKDDDGKTKKLNSQYVITDKQKFLNEIENAQKILKKKFSKCIKERSDIQKQIQQQQYDLSVLTKYGEDIVPDEIDSRTVDILAPLIELN